MQIRSNRPIQLDDSTSERNWLLKTIPQAEYDKIAPHLERVTLRLRQNLIEANEPVRYVYFLQSGMLSVVNDMRDGHTSIEVGVIGREGMVGLAAFLDSPTMPLRMLVQVAGIAKRMPVDDFKRIMHEGGAPTLDRLLRRYTLSLLNHSAQTSACNRLHSLEERCAKWLLTTHDHLDGEELPLTQEFLSIMLGVRRPGVTVAARTLQTAGLIRYTRGRITIVDRPGLEDLSCECYQRIREEYERQLGKGAISRALAMTASGATIQTGKVASIT